MKEKEDLKLVIVGHVDHGKSTLIGRLFFDTDSLPKEKKREVEAICKEKGQDVEFAFVMDQLEEEQDQGITIDTTQTFFKTNKRHYTIIDAPGHKEFLKNMITGASQAEAAILMVDADEGVQEQTKRHAYLLSFLGIEQIIVVMNKMDLVDYKEERFKKIENELVEFLEKLNINPTYIIPISAKQGDNVAKKTKEMNWYEGLSILDSLDTFESIKVEEKDLRFPIQDVYKIDEKRINVGTIGSGKIKEGDKILILPANTTTKVKSIEVFEKEITEAEIGESIGITTSDPVFIERGEVISLASNPAKTSRRFKAEVFWMSKLPFSIDEKITLRCTTQEVDCKIEEIERKINSSSLEIIHKEKETLKETEAAEVIIETKKPIVVEKFNNIAELGRFVLVRNDITVASGIIREVN